MELTVRVPGSCGEVMQGPWGLITCPVDRFSTVTVRPGSGQLCGGGEKACRALHLALAECGRDTLPYDFILTSELPQGKGMASSSADICAVLAAVTTACGQPLSLRRIGRLAASIEPTDGVFYPGLAMVDPEKGEIMRTFLPVPAIPIAVFDAGGTVDTVAFHRSQQGRIKTEALFVRQARQRLLCGISAERLGEAASRSALANQAVLLKPAFPSFLRRARQHACVVGVNAAHSGTVAGVFFRPGTARPQQEAVIDDLSRRFPQWTYYDTVCLCSGGIFIESR